MTYGLTRTQGALLRFVAAFIAEHGYPPTLKEILQRRGGKSPTGPLDMLNALASKGMLVRTPRISRGIRLTDEGQRYVEALAAEESP